MKKLKILWIFLTFIPILLIILGYIFPSSFFSSQEQIRNFVTSFGIWAPIIFILLQILQVIITPLSHYSVSVAGGFIFGLWPGFLYNWIGRVFGTIIAFFLGKIFGRKIIKHVVKPGTLKKYDQVFNKGKLLLFLAYFAPFFPDDELSYLSGVSSLKSKIFVPLIILGHISGSLYLAYVGNGISSITAPTFLIISGASLIPGILFAILYRRKKKLRALGV